MGSHLPAVAKLTAISSGFGFLKSRLDHTAVAFLNNLHISHGRG